MQVAAGTKHSVALTTKGHVGMLSAVQGARISRFLVYAVDFYWLLVSLSSLDRFNRCLPVPPCPKTQDHEQRLATLEMGSSCHFHPKHPHSHPNPQLKTLWKPYEWTSTPTIPPFHHPPRVASSGVQPSHPCDVSSSLALPKISVTLRYCICHMSMYDLYVEQISELF